MKKYVLAFLTCFLIGAGYAQITMQPNVPSVGLILKRQLWNVLVINSTPTSKSCRMEFTLRNRLTAMDEITASTGSFVLPTGSTQLNYTTLNPITYVNVSSSAIRLSNEEFIPIGAYTACYRLLDNNSENVVLAEECISLDVEPLSPPMLAMPNDSSKLLQVPNNFMWIPPSPLNLFNQLQYEFLLVPILPTQRAEEAIQQNLPILRELNLNTNQISYTGINNSLQKDKWYAWQIIAKDGANYAAKSEIWVFKVVDSVKVLDEITHGFIQINEETKGLYVINKKQIDIKLYSKNSLSNLIFKLFNNSDNKLILEKNQNVYFGDNYISINLNGTFKVNNYYKLVIYENNITKHELLIKLIN